MFEQALSPTARAGQAGPPAWADLLAPLTPEVFARDYWGQAPLHLARGAALAPDSVINLADVERHFASIDFWSRGLLTTPGLGLGPPEPPPASMSELHRRVAAGSMLRVRRLESVLDPGSAAVRLARDMERSLGHRLESLSCYVSPPMATGLGPHHDDSEIITLQISGEKRWRLYHQVLATEPALHRPETLGAPSQDILLRAGDLLYTPAGLVHEVTGVEASFSLTFVFEPLRWTSLVDLAQDRARRDPTFCAPLPGHWPASLDRTVFATRFVEMRQALCDLIMNLTPQDVDDFRTSRLLATSPSPAGQLETMMRSDTLEEGSWVRRRLQVDWKLTPQGDHVRLLASGGYTLLAHRSAERALRAVLDNGAPVAAGALHESLSPSASIALAWELILGGVLETVAMPIAQT
jgi:ribosomal protein L16 Arg81 hydroxylase